MHPWEGMAQSCACPESFGSEVMVTALHCSLCWFWLFFFSIFFSWLPVAWRGKDRKQHRLLLTLPLLVVRAELCPLCELRAEQEAFKDIVTKHETQ